MIKLSPKDRGLIKGAVRRVFARSELHRKVVQNCILPFHEDLSRPRVKVWCKCAECKIPTPKSYMCVDHIDPVIPINSSLEEMSWDDLINRVWCDIVNLQALCPDCHQTKTKAENAERRKIKKERKK